MASKFDIKTAIGSYAPILAKMLLGPLAGGAVGSLVEVLGLTPSGNQDKDVDAIGKVIQSGNLTPDQIMAIKKEDQRHAEIISQQGIDLTKINNDHIQAMKAFEMQEAGLVVDDVKNAREHNANSKEMWYFAWFVMGIFAIVMISVLVGCYFLLEKTVAVNPNLAVAIAGLVGSVVGYVAANAQTVINFIFGGSIGSRNSAKGLADSTKQAIGKLASSTPVPVVELEAPAS
ncbi:MAG: hypothetical protein ACD_84C00020G0004 [uncultured bacterium]|nr:MAG: hypothetical protein ACD_84C00020G0004 [uncultured bacterium]